MARYADWADVVNRYPLAADLKSSVEGKAEYVDYAEAYIEGTLAGKYTVPFSTNNVTVKDLTVDVSFAKILMFKDTEKSKAIMEYVNSVIGALSDGNMQMMTTSSDLIGVDGGTWSATEDYTPTFTEALDITDMEVDPDKVTSEEDDRGIT